MLVDVAIVALIVGWILRGSLAGLAEVELRGLLLTLLSAGLQYGSQYAAGAGWIRPQLWGLWLYAGGLLLLIAVLWFNRRNPALLLIGTGIFLNFLVIASNGGKMPVSAEGLARAGLAGYIEPLAAGRVITHQLLDETTRLPFLADILALSRPYPRPKVFSLGDLVLAVGALWLIVGGMIAHPSVTGKPRAVEVRRFTLRS